jgi:hypothetical protein
MNAQNWIFSVRCGSNPYCSVVGPATIATVEEALRLTGAPDAVCSEIRTDSTVRRFVEGLLDPRYSYECVSGHEVASVQRRDLARAAWTQAGAEILDFDSWWATCAVALTSARWGCPPLILAIAAWNSARGRDRLITMPPVDGAAFETWYVEHASAYAHVSEFAWRVAIGAVHMAHGMCLPVSR